MVFLLAVLCTLAMFAGIGLLMYTCTDSCRKERRMLFTFLGCLIIVTSAFITFLATGTISLPSLLKEINGTVVS
ncbi:hypothetical protein B5G37_14020 [Pseudoflavonifractor sp. An85]|nr:hypothetical protein B5G37_14020 [Pseudoflavonifractor sp. An85]